MSTPLFDLRAQLQLDDGQPTFFEMEDEEGRSVASFHIDLILEAKPGSPKVQRVTFVLDDTYEEPLRRARRERTEFAAEITSYGEFAVLAKIETEDEVYAEVGWLSDLLEKGHEGRSSTFIRNALELIRAN
jgi:hypothetical protein